MFFICKLMFLTSMLLINTMFIKSILKSIISVSLYRFIWLAVFRVYCFSEFLPH